MIGDGDIGWCGKLGNSSVFAVVWPDASVTDDVSSKGDFLPELKLLERNCYVELESVLGLWLPFPVALPGLGPR